jgi:hypothetical protein
MFNLFLVAMAVAFFLALLQPVAEVLEIFTSTMAVNAIFAIGLSFGGNAFIGFPVKELILRAVACAFLSRVLLTGAERLSTYRPAVIRQK